MTLVEAGREGSRRWSIGWLLVVPEARRRGVGRLLVATAVEAAAADGAREVWAETDTRWPAATAFWHRLGFAAA